MRTSAIQLGPTSDLAESLPKDHDNTLSQSLVSKSEALLAGTGPTPRSRKCFPYNASLETRLCSGGKDFWLEMI